MKIKTRRFHEVATYNFAEWLKTQLVRKQMKQSKLAKLLNVNVMTVSGWVCGDGKHMPRMTSIWRMCVILQDDEYTASDLFDSACMAMKSDLMHMQFPDQ